MTETMTYEELRQALDDGGVTVVQTLRAEHFAQGQLPGAVPIHFEAIREAAPEPVGDRDAAIVTDCSTP